MTFLGRLEKWKMDNTVEMASRIFKLFVACVDLRNGCPMTKNEVTRQSQYESC